MSAEWFAQINSAYVISVDLPLIPQQQVTTITTIKHLIFLNLLKTALLSKFRVENDAVDSDTFRNDLQMKLQDDQLYFHPIMILIVIK